MPRELRLFDGSDEFAVFQHRARGVSENATYSENQHFVIGPRMNTNGHESKLCFASLFDFRPGVFQGHGPVEDWLVGRGVRVYAEVAEALELVERAGGRIGDRGLQFGR